MKTLALALFVGVASLFNSGCAVYMAATQPPQVDIPSIEAGGMSRDYVIEKLGVPKSSTKNPDGTRSETYEFYEGSNPGWKWLRAAVHATADFFTLFLWELVGFPSEFAIRGDKITALAEFDKNERLTSFRVLGREQKPLEKIHKQQNGA